MTNQDRLFSVELEEYRAYLLLLAQIHLQPRFQSKIAPSDIVQQTLLEAHQQQGALPKNVEELRVWLRTALANNIRDHAKHLQRKKRDFRRERSLDDALELSSRQLAMQVSPAQSSPSQKAIRAEELLYLADALWRLPAAQRDAIVFHHLQGLSLAQTAKEIGKSETAIAGLLHRGLQNLRKTFDGQLAGGDNDG